MKSQDIEHLKDVLQKADDISNADRAKLLELVNTFTGYGLVWVDKQEDNENKILNGQMPVFKENLSRYIKAQPNADFKSALGFSNPQTTLAFDNTEEQADTAPEADKPAPHHLLIEGDNLPVLTALSYTHEGMIDVIYIDPPYNTGNKDFRYNDRFVDKEDPYRHSKWLSFMHKRLILAKRLLKTTGVIFISIDDNEQANLKLLCDEVFDEGNFVASIVIKKKTNGNNMGVIPPVHDYALVFAKNVLDCCITGFAFSDDYINSRFSNPDNDLRGPWTTSDLSANHVGPNFIIKNPSTNQEFHPPKGRYWVFNEQEVLRRIAEGRIIFGKNGTGKPIQKKFLHEKKSIIKRAETWWENHGLNSEGTSEIAEIMNSKQFVHPKPKRLIQNFLRICTSENTPSVILDFFAGSGTTLHAVMQLNAEDGGNRQCILVTNNENNIAEEVCYERNKRVINGYTKPNGTAVKGLTDNHLHYYEQTWFDEAVPLNPPAVGTFSEGGTFVEHSHIRLGRLMREMLMIKEACFTDIEADILRGYHPDLVFTDDNHPDLDVLESADKYMVIIYTDDAIADGVKIIEALPNVEKKVVVYPFEYQNAPDLSPYEHLDGRTITVNALPSSYKTTYDHILEDLRKRRRRFVISDEDIDIEPPT